MKMVGSLLDCLIDVWVQMSAEHATVIRTGNDMPEVADDGVDHEQLPVGIPIVAPGVGAAMRDIFKDLAGRMKTPDGAVQLRAFVRSCARSTDSGGVRDTMATIKPAVRTPAQAIDDVVADGLGVKPIQQDFRLAIGHIITVFVSDEAEAAVV